MHACGCARACREEQQQEHRGHEGGYEGTALAAATHVPRPMQPLFGRAGASELLILAEQLLPEGCQHRHHCAGGQLRVVVAVQAQHQLQHRGRRQPRYGNRAVR